jgi:hypothetical protein
VDAASQVAQVYQSEGLDDFVVPDFEGSEQSDSCEVDNTSFLDCGFYYTHATDECWILILSRFLNTKVAVDEVTEKGVQVSYEAVLPTVTFLERIYLKTTIHANMFNFSPRSHTRFISSPKPLDSYSTQIEKDISDPHWIVLVIPFLTQSTSHIVVSSDVIQPASPPTSSSSSSINQ